MKKARPGIPALLFGWFFTCFFSAFGQSVPYNDLLPPNTFRHPDNPYYWKNKPPHSAYWQQDTYYNIVANMDEKEDEIQGKMTLTYWNNSPDTITHAFFHLYQNAFQPCSYLDKLHKENKHKPKYGRHEADGLGTVVHSIRSLGKELEKELDNTILKVWLARPLLPGDSVIFEADFTTYFGSGGEVRRRMKTYNAYGYKHYNGVHWYPRISVYDRKFGWTTDQHLGREFYGDFGAYDVELTFSDDFIVEATGNLVNRQEVLPDSLRQQLDLSNFKSKPLYSEPSVIIPYNPELRKTWKFHAENVHDFAWTASPIYRIGEEEWNGIKVISLVQEPHASRWQNSAPFTAKVIEVFSRDIGMYGYPKIIVADAQDGMEYPMLTLDSGLDPGNRGLLAHEVGHNWFFGMVGTNETYRAFLDEGFTQFLTAWALEAIDGPYPVGGTPKSGWHKRFRHPRLVRDLRVYYGYLMDAVVGEDPPLNTHSDGFGGALGQGGGYRHVYSKTATMLYNLQYVLGDTLFQNAFKHYFETWKFCHPYPEDFRDAIIQSSKVDLNWFFDQWLETSKSIDYSILRVKKNRKDKTASITFKRKGGMQMPIDFSVVTKKGDTLDYHIPNGWFEKETEATILPRWIGWDKLQPTYKAEISLEDKIKNVIIDRSERLADINMIDNRLNGNLHVELDHQVNNLPNWRKYSLNIRPDVWYNAYDGFKLGLHLNGNYMRQKHLLHFSAWANTRAAQGRLNGWDFGKDSKKNDYFSYVFSYQNRIDKILPGTIFKIETRFLDGLDYTRAGLSFRLPKSRRLEVAFKSLYRHRDADLHYLLFPGEWESEKFNNSLDLIYSKKYTKGKASGGMELGLRSSALLSDFDYHYLFFEAKNKTALWKFDLKTRVFARYGTGSRLAPESALFLAGASPEEMMDNKFTRSIGWFPQSFTGGFGNELNHFHHGGGMNLRGYAGYTALELLEGTPISTYSGHSGAALNVELQFDRLFTWLKPKYIRDYVHIDPYLFADAGVRALKDTEGDLYLGRFRMNAGAGCALTIKKFGPLEKVKPLTIRFDVPFFLNAPPGLQPDYFAWRYIIGINRAF